MDRKLSNKLVEITVSAGFSDLPPFAAKKCQTVRKSHHNSYSSKKIGKNPYINITREDSQEEATHRFTTNK